MTTLAAERIERPPMLFGDAEARGDLGGGPTLDDAIVGAWEGLAAQVVVACPICSGALAPRGAGGRCSDCGTTLG